MSVNRLSLLRSKMLKENIDAFIINNKANRYYMTGFTGSYGQAVIGVKEQYIIADGRYFEQLKKQSPDFTVIDNEMQMIPTIQMLLKKKDYQKVAIESDDMNVTEYLGLLDKDIELVSTQNWIENQRMIKEPTEIKHIQKAADITDRTFEHILKYMRPGMTERQVANEIDQYGISIGADGAAFETIVASGVRSALPHGHASDKVIQDHELVVLDFGFLKDKYYSDITRTIAMGNVSSELLEVYQLTLDAQELAIAACQIGRKLKEIDATARNYIAEHGRKENFLHGTGHGLGLTVHEYPLLNQDSEEKIQINMTFTVEPGIYLAQKGGVRIEDDIWIDSNGQAQLMTQSPKELLIL